MKRLKIGFWLGALASIVAIGLLAGSWYYYHQTAPVAYLNKTLKGGSLIDYKKDVVIKKELLPDLPDHYIRPGALQRQSWRVLHTVDPQDPLTYSNITDTSTFTMAQNQVIVSHSFDNTGLVSFLKPGDRITLIQGTLSLPDILVLGKADKSGNITDLLPSLSTSSTILAPPSTAPGNPNTIDTPNALLLLMTVQQLQTLNQMKIPSIAMYGRSQMVEKQGGTANGQALHSTQPSKPR